QGHLCDYGIRRVELLAWSTGAVRVAGCKGQRCIINTGAIVPRLAHGRDRSADSRHGFARRVGIEPDRPQLVTEPWFGIPSQLPLAWQHLPPLFSWHGTQTFDA